MTWTEEGRTAVVVRPSVAEDVEAWLDVFTAVAAEGRWIGTEVPIDRNARRERFLNQLDNDQAGSFVAVADGRLVGGIGVELRAGTAELGMFVAPDNRAAGVGSALMQACLDWARSAGAHKLTLEVWPHNFAARALYTKFGFITEGRLRRAYRRRNGELWDALSMGLVLDTTSPGPDQPGGKNRGVGNQSVLSMPPGGLHRDDLLLRPGRLSDAGAVVAAFEDREIHRWLSLLPDPYTTDDALAFLCEARQGWAEGTRAHFFLIKDDAVLGGIDLRLDPSQPGLGEVGYWVARPVRGLGIATTALNLVVDWAFAEVGLRRIELHAAVENLASRKVAERAAFQEEGVKRAWRQIEGEPTDFVLYARLTDTGQARR
jgi:putative acetyltransferase